MKYVVQNKIKVPPIKVPHIIYTKNNPKNRLKCTNDIAPKKYVPILGN